MKNKIVFIILMSVFLQACSDQSLGPFYHSIQGKKEWAKEHPSLAMDHWVQAVTQNPFQFENQFNLGFGFADSIPVDKNDKNSAKKNAAPDSAGAIELSFENAKKSYTSALNKAKTESDQFSAIYNLADLHVRVKKVDEALKYYQMALRLDPLSYEIKHNIELIIQSQSGGGKGENQQQSDDQNQQNDQNQQDQKDQKDKKDQKDQQQKDKDKKDQKDGDDDKKKDQPKQYQQSPKYKPRPFQGELPETELKKILNELQQQERRIRAEYNKKEIKEAPHGKDW